MPGAHFQAPLVVDNVDGWGPTDNTFQYKDMPYQPYSKSDQIGKVWWIEYNFTIERRKSKSFVFFFSFFLNSTESGRWLDGNCLRR